MKSFQKNVKREETQKWVFDTCGHSLAILTCTTVNNISSLHSLYLVHFLYGERCSQGEVRTASPTVLSPALPHRLQVRLYHKQHHNNNLIILQHLLHKPISPLFSLKAFLIVVSKRLSLAERLKKEKSGLAV